MISPRVNSTSGNGDSGISHVAVEIRLLISVAIRTDPKRCVGALLEPLGSLAAPAYALLLGALADAILTGGRPIGYAIGLLGVVIVQFLANWGGTSMRARLAEQVGFAFDREIMELNASLPTLDHVTREEFSNRIELLRQGQGLLGQSLTYLTSTLAALVSSIGTVVVLVRLDPIVLLLVLFVVPTFLTVSIQRRWESHAETASASTGRLARHLRGLTTDLRAAPELRVYDLRDEITNRFKDAWRTSRQPIHHSYFLSSVLAAARAVIFAVGLGLTIGYVLWQASLGKATAGDVVTAAVICQQVERQILGPMYGIAGLGRVLRNAGRVLWLRTYARSVLDDAKAASISDMPTRLRKGVRLEHVSLQYPNSSTPAVDDLSCELPAGSVVAIVGENGAGKSSVVKLLSGMYEPTSGAILIEGSDLATISRPVWHAHLAAVFQDYVRPEFTAETVVGIGDLPRLGDEAALSTAIERANAGELIRRLPGGMRQQLGADWPHGTGLSGGQWQRLAVARGLMRDAPLLLFLDEPAASLDAAAERELLERYMGRARSVAEECGGVSFVVTHRFSTVRGADVILVMDKGRLVEIGRHEDLLEIEDGQYRRLYEMQVDSYRSRLT